MLGIVYTIIATLTFALNGATFRRGVVYGSAVQGVYVTILGGVPLFLIAALVTGQLARGDEISAGKYAVLGLAGLLHFLFGRYANFRAVAAIGQTRIEPLLAVSTLVSVGIAVLFLDEVIKPSMAIGIALVMVGPALVVGPRRRPATAGRSVGAAAASDLASPQHRLAAGYAWGTANALAFGTSPVLIGYALSDTGLGVLGGLVAYVVAASVLLPGFALPGQVGSLRGMSADAVRWFGIGTFTVFAAQMFRFLALSAAPVSLVVPLMRGGAVFTVLFAYLINRRYESFERRVLAGIAISITGSVALVI